MEDLVALRITRKDKTQYAVLAYGRLLDSVEPAPLEEAYLLSLSEKAKAKVAAVSLCYSLQEVSMCRYFYEGLFTYAVLMAARVDQYEKWAAERAAEYRDGVGKFYLIGDIQSV